MAFNFFKTVDEITESVALDTDLKTWANAQGWKLSDEDQAVDISVDYDFDDEHITEGIYKITFSTTGREFKIHTTDYVEEGKEVGVAINPSTSVHEIECDLVNVDYVTLMSVNPGFGGQRFIPESLRKIRALDEIRKREGYEFRIMVDGGVNLKNHIAIKEAGADILITGEAFFKASDPAAFVEEMES